MVCGHICQCTGHIDGPINNYVGANCVLHRPHSTLYSRMADGSAHAVCGVVVCLYDRLTRWVAHHSTLHRVSALYDVLLVVQFTRFMV